MKILKSIKCDKEDIKYDEGENPSLPPIATEEEAQDNKLGIYVNEEWKYVIGKETVDFVFLSVKAYTVYGEKEDRICDRLYQVEMWTCGELFQIEVTQREYYDEKWLKDVRTKTLLIISKRSYQKLVKLIKPIEEESFYFDTIGIHKLNDKYYYAASNCAVTSSGVDKSIKALQEGFDLEYGEDNGGSGELRSIETFMKYSKWNYQVFYSIHCISILAVLRYFLNELGISAGAVLWIDGSVASGKTSLATAMGDFFNRGDNWENRMRHLHTTKAKIKDIVKELAEYRNAVFILDDIKKEETVRNRESAKNITDILVRSVYMGKTGEEGIEGKSIDATAIITGEFYNEKESTTSRVLYLNINNFLEDDDNKKQLDAIQQDKYYLARFMVYFLQWLMKRNESNEKKGELEIKLWELQEELAAQFHGKLSRRMIETVANFQLVSEILDLYFQDSGISEARRKKFNKESKEEMLSLGKATLNKSLDSMPVIIDSFIEILPKLTIKDCRYSENYLHLIEMDSKQIEFYYENECNVKYDKETGVSDNGKITKYKKMLLLGLEKGYDGLMYNIKGKDTLLVKVETICQLVREKTKMNMQKWNFKYYGSEFIDERILLMLLNNQYLYAYRRKGDVFSKIVNMPEFYLGEDEYGERFFMDKTYQMVKVNIDSKVIYKGSERLKKIPLMESYDICERLRKTRHYGAVETGREYRAYEAQINEVFTEINRLIDLKQ